MNLAPGRWLVPILLLTSCAASAGVHPKSEQPAPCLQPVEGMFREVVPLQHADSQEVAETITELLDASRQAAMFRLQNQGGCALRIPDAPVPVPEPMARILPDPRSNCVLVQAVPEDMPRLIELIELLDVQRN
jgi:type II secretory pathway component GspD/PulD (secretin)